MKEAAVSSFRESWQLYRRLLGHVLPYWPRLAVAMVCMVVVAGATTAVAYLLKPVIDEIFVNKDRFLLAILPAGILALYLVKAVADYGQAYFMSWVGHQAMRQLRDDMFQRLLRMPVGFFNQHASGTLISRLTYDVDQVRQAITRGISTIIKDSLTAIFLLGLVFYHDWSLALVSLVGLPLVIAPLIKLTRKLRNSSRTSQKARAAMTRVLEESVAGNLVVKAYNGEGYEAGRFHREAEAHRRQNMRRAQAAALSPPLIELVGALGIVVVIYLGGYRVISPDSSITTGTFFSFLTALLMLYDPLKRLSRINATLQQGLAAGERIYDLLDRETEPNPGTTLFDRAEGEVRFEGVRFGYEPGEPVLGDIWLTMPAGSLVALVGPSGGGKSTLAGLLPRFHRPDAGRILLDSQDIETVELGNLRAQMAMVSQEVVLFNDTLAANIAYGRSDASRAEVRDAAEAAGVMEFATRLEDGLDHHVGERGTRLSGGQRQRLAIARALLRDAPILILDEATSSLDPHSERLVQQGLDRLMDGRTSLVIAHRLATIQRADTIAVMEEGRIVEQGRHDELLAQGGAYAHLWRTQFATDAEESVAG